MTAFSGLPAKLALTLPAPLGASNEYHSDTPVVSRPAHCVAKWVQFTPKPETPVTATWDLLATAARCRPGAPLKLCAVVTLGCWVEPPATVRAPSTEWTIFCPTEARCETAILMKIT